VRRLVIRNDAVSGLEQREREAAHLSRVAAPAVREQHRGRILRAGAPGPHGDVASLVLEPGVFRIDQVERARRGVLSARRSEEHAFRPGIRQLGEQQVRSRESNVRANSGQ
jgi:hypothetical protein